MKVFITGASSGIGYAIATKLLENNEQVVGASRRDPKREDPNYSHFPLDLNASFDEKKIAKQFFDIDALILSAGMAHFGFLEQLSAKKMEELLRVNFLSQALLIKGFLPMLKKKKSDLILIGSECALAGKKRASIYAASKFAFRGFMQSLQDECEKSSVRISILQPGLVKTPFYSEEAFLPDENSLNPEDIAEMVTWILQHPERVHLPEMVVAPKKSNVIWAEKKPK